MSGRQPSLSSHAELMLLPIVAIALVVGFTKGRAVAKPARWPRPPPHLRERSAARQAILS